MESIYFENVREKGMSIAALGKGKKTDAYPAVCTLWFGTHFAWGNPRCRSDKDGEKIGRSHESSDPKWTRRETLWFGYR